MFYCKSQYNLIRHTDMFLGLHWSCGIAVWAQARFVLSSHMEFIHCVFFQTFDGAFGFRYMVVIEADPLERALFTEFDGVVEYLGATVIFWRLPCESDTVFIHTRDFQLTRFTRLIYNTANDISFT